MFFYNSFNSSLSPPCLQSLSTRFTNLLDRLTRKVLAESSVVVSTCASGNSPRDSFGSNALGRYRGSSLPDPFTALVVDEAGQCADSDLLIPIGWGSMHRVVLVGDHKQVRSISLILRYCAHVRYRRSSCFKSHVLD